MNLLRFYNNIGKNTRLTMIQLVSVRCVNLFKLLSAYWKRVMTWLLLCTNKQTTPTRHYGCNGRGERCQVPCRETLMARFAVTKWWKHDGLVAGQVVCSSRNKPKFKHLKWSRRHNTKRSVWKADILVTWSVHSFRHEPGSVPTSQVRATSLQAKSCVSLIATTRKLHRLIRSFA